MRLGEGVPALVALPESDAPCPAVFWMHGRTAYKELDPGRYLRWVRAGIAAVALDLPLHGERAEPGGDHPSRTVGVVTRMVGEIDGVVSDALDRLPIDRARLAIGGMSAGGMAALRRLCDPHPFVGACVEGTTGDLEGLYFSDRPGPARHDRPSVETIDPSRHLGAWRAVPLLALHNELDELVPLAVQQGFIDRLRERYREAGSDPGIVDLRTFPQTGAPQEHAGFGRFSAEAKSIQLEFLRGVFGLLEGRGGGPEDPGAG